MMKTKSKPLPVLDASKVAVIWSKVSKSDKDACWPWTGSLDSNGYGRFPIDGRYYRAHRLVLATLGLFSQLEVCHSCNNPACVNPNHLRFGTARDNYNDRLAAGTDCCGSKCVTSKLNESDVLSILEQLKSKSQSEVAKVFGVTQVAVSHIATGKSWKHVTKGYK